MTGIPGPTPAPTTPRRTLVDRLPDAAKPLAAVGVGGLGALLAQGIRTGGNGLIAKYGVPNIAALDFFYLGAGAVSMLQGVSGRSWTNSLYTAAVALVPKLCDLAVTPGYHFEHFGKDAALYGGVALLLWGMGSAIKSIRW